MDFKFDKHVPRDIPEMTSIIFSKKRAWSGSIGMHDPDRLFFWGGGVNPNCSNTLKDTNLKVDKHVPRDFPDMTPSILTSILPGTLRTKFSEKRAWPGTHDPLIFFGGGGG